MHAQNPNTEITTQVIKDHGLSPSEYETVLEQLGRAPNLTELGIISVMWSEHCSYKSSRIHLKTLPTEAPWVIQGPGENAGVIDIGDNQAAIFKMESHNHPSFIEPYQGAATGVGGILRDVFTMGARPIANMNALRFGEPDHEKTRHLVSGVVAGIGGYGNCVGVPTVGGETNFHKAYNGNILVNAMNVGLADQDKIFYSAAAGVGNPVVYVGSKTGRDGIHGATMASAEFSDDAEEKRPTVQVGDPFTEKLLIEACLELMASDSIIAIQDMGAAGLTSSSVEMASKGRVGIHLNMNAVPCREEAMLPYEMMLSESQERMLMILRPEKQDFARAIFEKWGLDFAVIGHLTDSNHLVLEFDGEIVCDLPIDALADAAPAYDRPFDLPTPPATIQAEDVDEADDYIAVLKQLVSCPDLASRRWIWEQYDHMVMADTIGRPGGDAAVVRVYDTAKALAISTDVTPRYCEADAFAGAKQAVAETWRNITAVGGTPLAITNCLNFGNPERPEIMGQFVAAIRGIGEAARTLDYPIVSGNVSLYNETNGHAVQPTPAIGGVGLLKDASKRASIPFKTEGDFIFCVGETQGHLGASLYLREICGREEGAPPPVDLDIERKNGDFVRGLIEKGLSNTVHDISDGGLAVALAEMAMASGLGAKINTAGKTPLHSYLFGEDQARYIVCIKHSDAEQMQTLANAANVFVEELGQVSGNELTFGDQMTISVAELTQAHEAWLPDYMSKADSV